MRGLFATILVLLSLAALAPSASAQSAGTDAKVILTVDGAVGAKAEFTRETLEALGLATIRTSTPWHDGVQTFEGVPLAKLMEKVQATGDRADVVALNRYTMELPLADFARYDVILATRRNGQPMDIKDKGPLFVIYPFDARPDLKTEVYYSRSVWQVRTITLR
jgi:hypothetical protein